MSGQCVSRQLALVHHLPAAEALLPATPAWTQDRFRRYCHAAGLPAAVLFTDRTRYAHAKGEPVRHDAAGETHFGLPGQRLRVPLVLIDPARCGTRALTETVIAHEVVHARYPSLGHSARFFHHVQQLLDTVAAADGRTDPLGDTVGRTLGVDTNPTVRATPRTPPTPPRRATWRDRGLRAPMATP